MERNPVAVQLDFLHDLRQFLSPLHHQLFLRNHHPVSPGGFWKSYGCQLPCWPSIALFLCMQQHRQVAASAHAIWQWFQVANHDGKCISYWKIKSLGSGLSWLIMNICLNHVDLWASVNILAAMYVAIWRECLKESFTMEQESSVGSYGGQYYGAFQMWWTCTADPLHF